MIETSVIDEIRQATDIVSVISDYVPLRRRGRNFMALCPFHSEKTASFTVSQEKQMFHCFGCGEGGNVFSFLMKAENISFLEAVKILADKAGVKTDINIKPGSEKSAGNAILFDIMESATAFFEKEFDSSPVAQEYAVKRGINRESANLFRIGFAPEAWDSLYKNLTARGFLPKDIEAAGLAIRREGPSLSYYDRFRNRLMFPVSDARGRVVAFGARSMDNSEPKYLNSPETALYRKGDILFALNLSKDGIKASDQALIMEGYMDVLSSFCAGFKNVVASSGTSLTNDQVRLLARYTNNFVLVFDSDAAGSAANERSIELLRGSGIYPKIAVLTGGKDPDEVIRKAGKEAFEKMITSSVPWLRYKIDGVLNKFKLDEPEGKSRALRSCCEVLSKESDQVILSEYSKYLSSRLNIDQDSILSEIKRRGYNTSGTTARAQKISRPAPNASTAIRTVIRLCSENSGCREIAAAGLDIDSVPDETAKKLLTVILKNAGEEDDISASVMDAIEDDAAKKFFSQIMVEEHEWADKAAAVRDCVNALRGGQVKNRIDALRRELAEAEKRKDLSAAEALQQELMNRHEELRAL